MSDMRTHLCGEIDGAMAGARVVVCGWARARRDHGGVIFIDLRDRGGILQIVADPANVEVFAAADRVRGEYVLRAGGIVRARPSGAANAALASGDVELMLDSLEILNVAAPPPFHLDDSPASEETRLRHRVVDLRGARMQENLRRRAIMARAAREWLAARGFVEIETPALAPPTPEGARDFLSPSRLHPGSFYALPQSPQLFKQMLMAAGFERYCQIARCFRDEDLRADRQPEFSQIDLEMSFVDEDDIMAATEEMIAEVFAAAGARLPTPFPRMPYSEAMRQFGADRPDMRNPLRLADVGDLMRDAQFKVFRDPANRADGRVAVLRLPGGGGMSRGEIDGLAEFVAHFGAKGLAYIHVKNRRAGAAGLSSPIVKFLPENMLAEMLRRAEAEDGDMLFFGAGREDVVNASLSALRDRLARDFNLLEDGWRPLWITDFPLFERDGDGGRKARHHPFTAPKEGDERHFPAAPDAASARAFDMTLNGVEIGGGGIRIHRADLQLKVLSALGFDEARARAQFGFLLSALDSGCPPHGGMAFGLDRMAAMACGAESIRDVVAFPKTQGGQCLLTGAPGAADPAQLRDLHIARTAPAKTSAPRKTE